MALARQRVNSIKITTMTPVELVGEHAMDSSPVFELRYDGIRSVKNQTVSKPKEKNKNKP